MKFFRVKEFFSVNFYFKNGCENEFEDNKENHAADSKVGPPFKLILEPIGLTNSLVVFRISRN